jgi:AmmeMemoRadiSam system protein B
MVVRPPVVAGSFYPAAPDELAEVVDKLLAAAHPSLPPGELRALVAPHAGYVYSGAVAASAFAAIPPRLPLLRVSLLGPSHFEPLDGVSVSNADAWGTPLGDVPVDGELRAAAYAAGAAIDSRPHQADHALEVELPFLQRRSPAELRVLPVALGGARTEAAAGVVAALALSSLIVVSTDLSHYLDDGTARERDRRTARTVVALEHELVREGDACGAAALRALLAYARGAGWACTLLDLRTSADASGDTRRVVGYGAFAFTDRDG